MLINISIDDVSPHPESSVRVVDRCFDLLRQFPRMKFTLFIPTAYWRTQKHTSHSPLQINEFPEFCEALKTLPAENFELCYHGHYHGTSTSDNDEFQSLNYDQAREKFLEMFEVVERCGLGSFFKPIFRPPAWRMSPDSFDAAKDAGIRTLALSPKEYAKNVYAGKDEEFENVVYYDCNPPFDDLTVKDKVEVVYHACEWDRNYFSIDLMKQLSEWLQKVENVNFCFVEELCVR